MKEFENKTVFITGASRGIGLAIGKRLAREGANIVIAAKTAEAHPELPGTIYSAAEEIEEARGKALPLVVDIRLEEQIRDAVDKAVKMFGGIDICINNASAISLTPTLQTNMKRYDLMHQVNTRGTFLTSKICIPHLMKSDNAHILNISPPLNMETKWFAPHLAYTMAKFGMSMCVLGMAGELHEHNIGVNALWPKTTVATAAVQNLLGGDAMVRSSRKPEVMSDAAYYILKRKSSETTGNYFIDEEVLNEEGIKNLSHYNVVPGNDLMPDFFI